MTRLEEIEKRLAAATPGPWRARAYKVGWPERIYRWDIHAPHDSGYGGREIAVIRDGFTTTDGTAALIAHAPTDLRDLLVVAKAARLLCEGCKDDGDESGCGCCEYAGVRDALAPLVKGPTDG